MTEQNITTHLSVKIYTSLQEIEADCWNSICTSIPFFQTYEFLKMIESIQQTLQFRYVLVFKNNRIEAALYFQLLDFSFRNLVNYSSEHEQQAGIKTSVKRYIARKNTKLLNLGNVFFTGDKGIIAKEESEVVEQLPLFFEAVKSTFKEKKPAASLLANIYLKDEEKCSRFCEQSFHPFITEPDMFMQLDENWHSMADYMNALSSKYRVRTKKIVSTSADIVKKDFCKEEVIAYKNEIQLLYNNVVNNVAFNMATLNIDFFENVKELYGDRCVVSGYFLHNNLVGFSCVFHLETDTMHVHYIGLNYDVNKEYKLYNRMLLDFVEFGIQCRVKHIHFGRTATEIKTTIGAKPNPLRAYLKMNNRFFNMALPTFLKRIKPPEYVVRNPFK
ncbi:MAG: hypothetical protein U0U67_11655 [Chitinophagales bacterium]